MKVYLVGHGYDHGHGEKNDDTDGIFLTEEAADVKADSFMQDGEWSFSGMTEFDPKIYEDYPIRAWSWESGDYFVYMQEWEAR